MSKSTIYDTISLPIYGSLVLGFFPSYIGKNGKRTSVKSNGFCSFISFFYLLLFSVMIYLGTLQFNPVIDAGIYNFNILAKLLILVVTIVGDFATYVLLIQSYFHKKYLVDFFNTTAHIDRALLRIGYKFDHDKEFFTFLALHIAGPVLITGNFLMQMWNIKRGTEKLPSIPPPLLFCHLFVFSTVHHGESLFLVCSTILTKRFQMVNRVLESLNRKFLARKSCQKIGAIGDLVKNSKTDDKLLDVCIRCHDKLSDMRDVVNRIFGFLIIVGCLIQFNTIVFAFCYCYYSISVRPISSLGWFSWALFRIYELARKAIAGHITIGEAQTVIQWVNKLLIHCDGNIEEKLKMFALQVRHRSRPFTALGLFPIDGTFAFTVIAASTTYITIIYQFQVSKLSC